MSKFAAPGLGSSGSRSTRTPLETREHRAAGRRAPLHRRALAHYWTIVPSFTGRRVGNDLQAEEFGWSVPDERYGEVQLSGSWVRGDHSPDLVIAVHGLGGCSESAYMLRLGAAAARAGVDCLRVNLRGADRRGQDLFHAGQFEDLLCLLDQPALSDYERIFFVGFSLGGHVCLRLAASQHPKMNAVAAICPPLDLAKSSAAFDRVRLVYRYHVLGGLKDMYRALRPDRRLSLADREVDRIATIRAWDEQIVAPRYGFESALDYYRAMSAAPRLSQIAVPTLLVAALHDPMVPIGSLEEGLAQCSSWVDVRRAHSGGHVGFPASLDLGVAGPRGLESQLLNWLDQSSRD